MARGNHRRYSSGLPDNGKGAKLQRFKTHGQGKIIYLDNKVCFSYKLKTEVVSTRQRNDVHVVEFIAVVRILLQDIK